MKKKLAKITIGVIVLFGIVLGYLSSQTSKTGETPTTERAGDETGTSLLPGADKITISGVEMNNFNNFAIYKGKIGDTRFIDEKDFKATYFPQDEAFLINIMASPFDIVRAEAEIKFLSVLSLDKDNSCKLAVYITTPRTLNPNEAGTNYRLSFCE